MTVSDVSVLSGAGLTNVPIDSGQLNVDFDMYFAVRTTDARNGADTHLYTTGACVVGV